MTQTTEDQRAKARNRNYRFWRRDRGICGICGASVNPNEMQLDHTVPWRLGGSHEDDNFRTAHPRCNNRRRSKIDWQPEPGPSPRCRWCWRMMHGASPDMAYCSDACLRAGWGVPPLLSTDAWARIQRERARLQRRHKDDAPPPAAPLPEE